MAASQGLYNGFLAAVLAWGLLHLNDTFGFQLQRMPHPDRKKPYRAIRSIRLQPRLMKSNYLITTYSRLTSLA
ncbi:DUF1304 family protein [Paenibacillus sp. S150]|nr:DUF1304 family protein [Paenibacillus sp. S150]